MSKKVVQIILGVVAILLYLGSGLWDGAVSMGRIMLPDSTPWRAKLIGGCGETFACPKYESALGDKIGWGMLILAGILVIAIIIIALTKKEDKYGKEN